MTKFNIQKWHDGSRVTVYTLNDKWIEFRVEYFKPGQSIEKPPAREIMTMIKNDEHSIFAIENRFDSCVKHILHNNGKNQTDEERQTLYKMALKLA